MKDTVKLVDLDCSVRLLNLCKYLKIETIGDLKEFYKNLDPNNKPQNMGLKSIREIEDILTSHMNNQTVTEMYKDIRVERYETRMKNVVKSIHNELFYKDEYDISKLLELNKKLNSILTNFNTFSIV